MAIVPTGDIYKGFVIGKEGNPGRLYSKSYGIYITGESVYNAPERDAEMIVIPGRNGALYRDNGRFENVEVTYHCGMFADSQTDFASNIQAFRNAIALRNEYKYLYDDYNTDEFRLAVYKSGLEVDPVLYSTAGEFDITFECKPQRFLKSGETEYTRTNGSSITNQGNFPSYPLLSFSASGSGTIGIGSQTIQVINEPFGETPLSLTKGDMANNGVTYSETVTINNPGIMNTSDTFTIKGASAVISNRCDSNIIDHGCDYASGQSLSFGGYNIEGTTLIKYILADESGATFTKGTPSTVTKTGSVAIRQTGYGELTQTVSLSIAYNGNSTITVSWTTTTPTHITLRTIMSNSNYSGYAISTVTSLAGTTVYIDLELGEAYKLVNQMPTPLNNFVNLGAQIPYLPGGTSIITLSDTITNFKITPRWWRI